MENATAPINLVRKNKTASVNNVINWVLSIGRLIVIITEIIAIAAFIYRFSLDEQLVRLHGEIKIKQNQLALLKQDELNFRNLQDRLALASQFSEENTRVYKIFQDIVNLTPQEVKFDDLALKKDRATLDITVSSIPSLTSFVNSLKNHSKTKSLSIDNIQNSSDDGLSVAISALFK